MARGCVSASTCLWAGAWRGRTWAAAGRWCPHDGPRAAQAHTAPTLCQAPLFPSRLAYAWEGLPDLNSGLLYSHHLFTFHRLPPCRSRVGILRVAGRSLALGPFIKRSPCKGGCLSCASPGQALPGWAHHPDPASRHPGPAGCWLFFLELSKEFGCKRFILKFYLGSMFLRIFYILCSSVVASDE